MDYSCYTVSATITVLQYIYQIINDISRVFTVSSTDPPPFEQRKARRAPPAHPSALLSLQSGFKDLVRLESHNSDVCTAVCWMRVCVWFAQYGAELSGYTYT